MNKLNVKTTLAAVALSLTLLSPAVQAEDAQAQGFTVGQAIASQGNAALLAIRADIKAAAIRAVKPMLPAAARTTKVSVPSAGSLPAGAAAAK
jgi:hypothetical protein